ncbi:Aldo/keto reductase [Mytilinidion resinicola]|uniref:Aldo/keto reductase n=1 Tax=Mytilinidion resinicola TaxID=574789 RepID=A0A6A6Z7N6_9PEZI|nr:Aldo/keto reductase [Mytilinidion resinicola]KAF2817121.1 Aldo/keto reductase [Mytilinidion resinicola]
MSKCLRLLYPNNFLIFTARTIELELVPCLRRYSISLVIYNPIAGGLFSGKIKSASTTPIDGRFGNTASTMGGMYRWRYFKDQTFAALALLEPIVAKHNLSMLEVAFRWLVHHSVLRMGTVEKEGDGIIMGISSFKQLEMNLEFCERGPLPEEVVEALEQAWQLTSATAPTYWHKELTYEYDVQKELFGEG